MALVIDADARRIVGWRGSPSLSTELALDALEQALAARLRGRAANWVHHRNRGVQNVSIRYPARLAQAGIEPSGGAVGDSDDNALAESIIGWYHTDLIRPWGPWRTVEAVEFATLAGVMGSTTGGFWNRSVIDRPPRGKPKMMSTSQTLRPDSN